MGTEVEVILDSVNAVTGDRITTMRCRFPRIILDEFVTHRILFVDDFCDAVTMIGAYDADIPIPISKNTSSSRAVPVSRMLERIMEDPFIPLFRKARRGMMSGELVDVDVQEKSEEIWQSMMAVCMDGAQQLAQLGVEKGQANRPLEFFSYVDALVTATEWNNFLLLREHIAAQKEIQELARLIRTALVESTPQVIYPGEWHLPYISGLNVVEEFAPISAARAARISYKSFDTGAPSSYAEDMDLYTKLAAGSPKHLSPLEHPALALDTSVRRGNLVGWQSFRKYKFPVEEAGGDFSTLKETA